jgi:nicotinate phosphoribosyltransferase
MRDGGRLAASPGLAEIRARAADSLARLPEPLRRLRPWAYPVRVSPALEALAEEVDRRIAGVGDPP